MTFREQLQKAQTSSLRAAGIEMLQVNLGYRCNMACRHCHVEAGPHRTEEMAAGTVDAVIAALASGRIAAVDLTGGAPELNPHIRRLVDESRSLGCRVIVRTNLTVLGEQEASDLPAFFRDRDVELIASLPSYSPSAFDRVRGSGAFGKSIEVLRTLNSLGYARERVLSLVVNPSGAILPASQQSLEEEFRRELRDRFGVAFSRLFAFANMPIGRFRDFLVRSGNYDRYMNLLKSAFNPAAVCGVMCRTLLSVGWDGRLFDCDFNQMIGLPVADGAPKHIADFSFEALAAREIVTGDHCFGCTAGEGFT